MEKQAFIEHTHAQRTVLETALARVADADMLVNGVSGEMSVRDILAHILWFEREMLDMLEQRAMGGSDLWSLPADQRNAAIQAASQARSLAEIRQAANQVYARLIPQLESLPDEAFNDPGYFSEMPSDWCPWYILDANLGDHYAHHAADIQAWVEARAGDGPF